MGICSINGDATKIMVKIVSAPIIPDKRDREPALILTKVCATMAQPPIPPKKPLTRLAVPCAIASLLALPFVLVNSSTIDKVSRDSIIPTEAMTSANGKIIVKVSQLKGIWGI
ncbi:hypothetical protein D3C72_1824140 [compost metagenome]